ncbi:hypothetical protein ABZP36_033724 [Zizania latifolia]
MGLKRPITSRDLLRKAWAAVKPKRISEPTLPACRRRPQASRQPSHPSPPRHGSPPQAQVQTLLRLPPPSSLCDAAPTLGLAPELEAAPPPSLAPHGIQVLGPAPHAALLDHRRAHPDAAVPDPSTAPFEPLLELSSALSGMLPSPPSPQLPLHLLRLPTQSTYVKAGRSEQVLQAGQLTKHEELVESMVDQGFFGRPANDEGQYLLDKLHVYNVIDMQPHKKGNARLTFVLFPCLAPNGRCVLFMHAAALHWYTALVCKHYMADWQRASFCLASSP